MAVDCSVAAAAGRRQQWEAGAWVVVAETEAVEAEDRSLAEAEGAEDRRRKTLDDPEEWCAAGMATEKQAFLELKLPQSSQTLSV